MYLETEYDISSLQLQWRKTRAPEDTFSSEGFKFFPAVVKYLFLQGYNGVYSV
jgi:hypothetical protein